MRLQCGCCGNNFSGKQDTEHDRGYGLCPSCSVEQAEDNEAQWDSIIKLVTDNLSEENRKDYVARDRADQIRIAHNLIDKGVIYFEVGA